MFISIMEMNQLRHFLAVAETGNVNKAASKLLVSPGTLSKAIAKLESGLGVNLFERVGRTIRITPEGRRLQRHASRLLRMEESIRSELTGGKNAITVRICGEELLLAEYAGPLIAQIRALYPNARFNLTAEEGPTAFEKLELGEAHLALTTEAAPKGLHSKTLDRVEFKTCVGKKHPLYKYARGGKAIPIETVLQHEFAVPHHTILGKTGARQSTDGWRDDKFPRKVGFSVSSVKSLEAVLKSGLALAYIPQYFADNIDVSTLTITGCPYSCEQAVHLCCRDPGELGWLNRIW